MTFALLVLVLVALVVLGAGAALQRRHPGAGPGAAGSAASTGQSVRRFFQYLLLAGLLFASAAGVTGLLGRVLDPGTLAEGDAQLALQLTFTGIALPIWLVLAWWTWRRLREDPAEAAAPAWALYLTLVGVIALLLAMTGWHRSLVPLVTPQEWDSGGLAQAVVWTVVWAGHQWWGRRTAPALHLLPSRLLGALIGLVTAAGGLVALIAPALRELLGLTGETLVGRTTPAILAGGVVLLIGAAVWAWHWLLDLAGAERSTGWLALVLLAGVGGGLLAAIVAASTFGYAVLVWLVGDPAATSARVHFADAPVQLAVVLTGALVWWYHQEVLGARRAAGRTEVRRVYEYLMSAIGLLAAASGLVMVLVTIVEAVAAGPDLVVGGRAINALLGALVLLVVGAPVWWWHWRQAQAARQAAPSDEVASPMRRVYLLILFGVMGVAAVVALLTLVYLVLEDALARGVDIETLRRIRFALGILLTTGLLSAYHWTVFRTDREVAPAAGTTAGGATSGAVTGGSGPARPRTVLLVGAADPEVGAALHRATGAQVQVMTRTDVQAPPWSADELATALDGIPAADVVVLAEPDGLRVIPVRR